MPHLLLEVELGPGPDLPAHGIHGEGGVLGNLEIQFLEKTSFLMYLRHFTKRKTPI